jgi:hypothetical protein
MNNIKYSFPGLRIVLLALLAVPVPGAIAGQFADGGQAQGLATIYVEDINSTYKGKQLPSLHKDAAQELTKAIRNQLIGENHLQTNPDVHALRMVGLMLAYRDNTLEVHGELFDDDRFLVYTLVERHLEPDGDWTEGLNLLAEELLDELIGKLRELQTSSTLYFNPNDCYTNASRCGSSYYIGWGWWRTPGNEAKSRPTLEHAKKHATQSANLEIEHKESKRHWDADAGGKSRHEEAKTEANGRPEPDKHFGTVRDERFEDASGNRWHVHERDANQTSVIGTGVSSPEMQPQPESERHHTRIGVASEQQSGLTLPVTVPSAGSESKAAGSSQVPPETTHSAQTQSESGWKHAHESGEWKSESQATKANPAASTESIAGSGSATEYHHDGGKHHQHAEAASGEVSRGGGIVGAGSISVATPSSPGGSSSATSSSASSPATNSSSSVNIGSSSSVGAVSSPSSSTSAGSSTLASPSYSAPASSSSSASSYSAPASSSSSSSSPVSAPAPRYSAPAPSSSPTPVATPTPTPSPAPAAHIDAKSGKGEHEHH